MTTWRGATMNVLLSGTGVPVAAQACSNIDSGAWHKYQITNTARRVWDPKASVVVYKNGVSQSSALYQLNRLYGSVNFLSALTNTDVVTVDVTYLPMTAVASANAIDCTFSLADQDSTTFASAGWTEREGTIGDVNGTISRFLLLDQLFLTGLQAGSLFVVEYDYTGTTPMFRAWVEFNKQDDKGDVSSLSTEVLTFVGTLDADGRQVATAA